MKPLIKSLLLPVFVNPTLLVLYLFTGLGGFLNILAFLTIVGTVLSAVSIGLFVKLYTDSTTDEGRDLISMTIESMGTRSTGIKMPHLYLLAVAAAIVVLGLVWVGNIIIALLYLLNQVINVFLFSMGTRNEEAMEVR